MPEFCSELTRAAGQSIVGTAAESTSAWVAIEWCEPWAAKAFENAGFSAAVRQHVDGWVAAIPNVRPQLIRRPGRPVGAPVTVYLGVSAQGHEQLRAFKVSSPDALADLDAPSIIDAMRGGLDPGQGEVVDRPVVLVCTHGKRDRCCAKWGTPVYERLCRRGDIDLWQTSHLGGHRFAATLLCLPHGICYGWLRPDEADPLVDALVRGELFRLDRLRGRTALSSAGQAAEHFVREHTGDMTLGGVQVERVHESGEGPGAFVATVQAGSARFELTYRLVQAGTPAPPSCGKDSKATTRYELSRMASD